MFDKSKIMSAVLAVIALSAFYYHTDDTVKVMTVNGAINATEMGTTLVHEHVLVDWIGPDSTGYHRWNRAVIVERILPFILEAKERGVDTIIECTGRFLGHDPYVVAELSRQSGVQFLTNTGFYGAANNQFLPRYAYTETAEEIADQWIDEFENGFDGSGIRPGIMKISVEDNQPLSELHRKIVEAAIKTHLQTGMTIMAHTVGDVPAYEQINLLKNEGVSPSAWVWAHAQTGSLEAKVQLAGEGAWLSLDGINRNRPVEAGGLESIEWYAERIGQIRDAGFLDKILLSHDAGWYTVGEPNGGEIRGYTDLFDYLIPELKDNGFSDDEIRQLSVLNPQGAYGIQVRRL